MQSQSGFLRLLVFLIHEVKELLDRQIVDGQKLAKAFDGDICFALFDSPILDSGQIVIICEIFVAAVAFFLAQIS